MNLHALVSGAIGSVNPHVMGSVKVSTGYVTGADGSRVPAYADPVTALMQLQAVTGPDLAHMDALNVQGILRSIHVMGSIDGLVRADNKGGDIISFANDATIPASLQGTAWLVRAVLETWDSSGWCRVGVVRQS